MSTSTDPTADPGPDPEPGGEPTIAAEHDDGFDQCMPSDLSDAVAQLAGVETIVRAELVRVIQAVDRRDAWEGDAVDLAHWVMVHAGVDRVASRRLVAVARTLPDLPAVAAAFAEGRLSFDRVRLLCEFATPADEVDLVEAATGWTLAQLEALAREARRVSRRESEENHRRRSLRIRWDRDRSSGRLTCRLDAPELAMVEAAIETEAKRHRRDVEVDAANAEQGGVDADDPPLPIVRVPWAQASADALVAICSAFTGRERDPDRATVVVHAGVEVVLGGDGAAVLANGVPIAPDTVRRLACDGRLQVVTENPDGTPIGIGRASRRTPPWLARQVLHRDQGCRFPCCQIRHGLQVHHINWWVRDHGRTDLDELVAACWVHHRYLHEGGWAVTGSTSAALTWTGPDGRTLTGHPPPPRPEVAARIGPLLPFPPAPRPPP